MTLLETNDCHHSHVHGMWFLGHFIISKYHFEVHPSFVNISDNYQPKLFKPLKHFSTFIFFLKK